MVETDQGQMKLTELTAITPLDGRYRDRISELSPIVSEYGLIKTRIEVEAKYLVALSEVGIVRALSKEEAVRLDSFGENISLQDAQKVKEIESSTRHDVKAMERAFRNMLSGTSLADVVEKVHIGLTSEDVNNLAYRLILKRATDEAVLPSLTDIILSLADWAERYKDVPMLARTHGQAALPTTVGKEMAVFADRLSNQTLELKDRKLKGKFSGAVGAFNAMALTYPNIDWQKFSKKFIKSLGLEPNFATTQINTYEDMVEYFQNYQRINGVLLDFDQDTWRYISDHWIVQKPKKGEVGSSTMPQKVNPIDFENSEGNLGLANSLFEYFSRKLQVSRLQRDLSDSTVIRNMGSALGYSLVAYKSAIEGMKRVDIDTTTISEALNEDWAILAEGVQTILRREGVEDPYSLIADLTRGKRIGKEEWQIWVDALPIDDSKKGELRNLTPEKYIGYAISLTEQTIKNIRKNFS